MHLRGNIKSKILESPYVKSIQCFETLFCIILMKIAWYTYIPDIDNVSLSPDRQFRRRPMSGAPFIENLNKKEFPRKIICAFSGSDFYDDTAKSQQWLRRPDDNLVADISPQNKTQKCAFCYFMEDRRIFENTKKNAHISKQVNFGAIGYVTRIAYINLIAIRLKCI